MQLILYITVELPQYLVFPTTYRERALCVECCPYIPYITVIQLSVSKPSSFVVCMCVIHMSAECVSGDSVYSVHVHIPCCLGTGPD